MLPSDIKDDGWVSSGVTDDPNTVAGPILANLTMVLHINPPQVQPSCSSSVRKLCLCLCPT